MLLTAKPIDVNFADTTNVVRTDLLTLVLISPFRGAA
jgi:hypothetical protein